MKRKFVIILVLVAAALGFAYFKARQGGTPEVKLRDGDFGQPIQYSCAGGKSFGVAFAAGVARISLDDKRVFTLEQRPSDEDSGVKYSNEGDAQAYWAKDDSAFITENGVETYGSCRAS